MEDMTPSYRSAVADVTHSYGSAFPLNTHLRQVNILFGGYTSLPGRRQDAASNDAANTVIPQDSVHGPVIQAPPLNMHLQNNIASQRMMVKECVKTKLFRRLKFFSKDVHGLYDPRNGTVCAMIIANCNVTTQDANESWWADMRKLVVCTHTDRRNNVIKNMHLRFKGTYQHRWDEIYNAMLTLVFCGNNKMACVVKSHTLKLTTAKMPIWHTCWT